MKTILTELPCTTASFVNSGTRFFSPVGCSVVALGQTTNTTTRHPVAVAGTFSNLVLYIPTPLSSGSYTLTMQKNNADTGLTVAVTTATGLTNADNTNTVSVSPGDDINFKNVPSATVPDAVLNVPSFSYVFTGTSAGEGVMFGGPTSAQTVTHYQVPGVARQGATASAGAGVMPTDGTIDQLYCLTNVAPSSVAALGRAWTWTLFKNGSSTALTASATDTATTATNTSTANAVSFVAGDLITMEILATGTPQSAWPRWSVRWTPTTDGESCLFGHWSGNPSATIDNYNGFVNSVTGTSVEANNQQPAPIAFTARKMQTSFAVAPGAGNSRSITLRGGGVSTTLTTNTTGTNTTGSDTTNNYAASAEELLGLRTDPVSSPTAPTNIRVGIAAFVDPGSAGGDIYPHRLLLLGVT